MMRECPTSFVALFSFMPIFCIIQEVCDWPDPIARAHCILVALLNTNALKFEFWILVAGFQMAEIVVGSPSGLEVGLEFGQAS